MAGPFEGRAVPSGFWAPKFVHRLLFLLACLYGCSAFAGYSPSPPAAHAVRFLIATQPTRTTPPPTTGGPVRHCGSPGRPPRRVGHPDQGARAAGRAHTGAQPPGPPGAAGPKANEGPKANGWGAAREPGVGAGNGVAWACRGVGCSRSSSGGARAGAAIDGQTGGRWAGAAAHPKRTPCRAHHLLPPTRPPRRATTPSTTPSASASSRRPCLGAWCARSPRTAAPTTTSCGRRCSCWPS